MKKCIAFALTCLTLLAAPAAHAQLGNIFRSITGALGGGGSAPPPQSGTTATIGVRGMDEGGTTAHNGAASPDAALLDTWTVRPDEATRAAQKRGLTARPVSLAGASAAAPAANANNADNTSGSSQP